MYILFSHFFLLLKILLKLTPCISVILFYCFSPSFGQFQISTLIKVLLAVVKKLKQLIFYCASFESKFIPFRKKENRANDQSDGAKSGEYAEYGSTYKDTYQYVSLVHIYS